MSQITSNITKITHVLRPLVHIKPALKPVNDIRESVKSNVGTWNSIGDDPQFICEFPKRTKLAGWYMFSVGIESSNVRDIARLYINTGNGFVEADTIGIPYQSRKSSKRLVRIPRNSKAIRFDPQSCDGEFTISEFTAVPVSFRFAESRMLKKLMHWKPSEQFATIEQTRTELESVAKRLNRSYPSVLEQHYSAVFSGTPESYSYGDWLNFQERLTFPRQGEIKSLCESENRPRLSVLLPTFNTDLVLLDEAIRSVVEQSYDNWQLCVSDGGSDQSVVDAVKRWSADDSRISACFQSEPTGISSNTNAALALATGDFCVFLDHDDLLAEHALYEVANAAMAEPGIKLIYSDEDKLDSSGQRVDPHFKPDWNPDLLLSQNYICHLVAIRRELLNELGGCRAGYDGAQDHDLLLRVMATVKDNEVIHIPKILYHWRMIAGSTAASADEKDYTSQSGVGAVGDYLAGVSPTARVWQGKYPNTYRVSWGLPEKPPLVSIIIPTRDRLDILSQCISSVLNRTTYPNVEVIVVDNESELDETREYFEEIGKLPNVRVLPYKGVFNFSAINNYAVEHARGDVITMMNNDIEVISENWLSEMVGHALRPEVGCVGAKLLYKNNMVQHAGVILGIGGVAGHAHKYFDSESAGYFSRLHLTQNMSAVTAACLTVKKRIYLQAGGLNESELKVAFNDVDFCLRVGSLGLRNVWTPYALLYHHESLSRGHENTTEKQSRFNSEAYYMQETWGDLLKEDPAYNPNLTLVREDFSLAA